MAEVSIPFARLWERKMLDGIKTTTWRTRKHGEPGDRFPAFGEKFELLRVYQLSYEFLIWLHYGTEGCESQSELRQIFRKLWHGTEPHNSKVGWLHEFRKL